MGARAVLSRLGDEAGLLARLAGYRLASGFLSLLASLNPSIGDQVLGSGLSTSPERYATLGLALLLVIDSVVVSSIYLVLNRIVGLPPGLAIAASLLAMVSATALVLAVLVVVPRMAYTSRGSRLEPRFPLFASSLATRLMAGSTLSGALLELAEREIEDLPEFRVELEYVASSVKLGAQLDVVLESAARITPSTSMKSLFSALAAASRTGAGIDDIIDAILREYLFNVEMEIDRVTSGLGAYMEIFVAASVMLPIAVGVVGLLLAFNPLPGLDFNTLLFATTFILTPMTAAAILVLADSLVSRIRL